MGPVDLFVLRSRGQLRRAMQSVTRAPRRGLHHFRLQLVACQLPSHQSNARRNFPTGPEWISLDNIRARQPVQLLRNDVYRAIPPEDVTPGDLNELASNEIIVDPSKILKVYKRHVAGDIRGPDVSVLLRAFTQLGFLFDPNSFFASADRQILRSHEDFRALVHDLNRARDQIPDAAAPVLLYAMSCLEYRCAPLLPQLLEVVERNLLQWRTDVLALLLHSIASLGIAGCDSGQSDDPVVFDLPGGLQSRNFSGLSNLLAAELGRRAVQASEFEDCAQVGLQDWARASFAMVMANAYDVISP